MESLGIWLLWKSGALNRYVLDYIKNANKSWIKIMLIISIYKQGLYLATGGLEGFETEYHSPSISK